MSKAISKISTLQLNIRDNFGSWLSYLIALLPQANHLISPTLVDSRMKENTIYSNISV